MKKEAMYKRYFNKKHIGYYTLSNVFGIFVFEPDEIDKYNDNCDLICAWSNGESIWGYHKHKIHYTNNGRAYIRKGSLRIYLDEIMRYNY